jgi:hypothetical protein
MVNYFGTATCNSGCPNNTDFAKWILVTSYFCLTNIMLSMNFNINWFGFYYFKLS